MHYPFYMSMDSYVKTNSNIYYKYIIPLELLYHFFLILINLVTKLWVFKLKIARMYIAKVSKKWYHFLLKR